MISLEDEWSVVQQVFEEPHPIEDAIAFFLPDWPVQLRPDEGFAEESNYADLAVGDHEEVSPDAIVRGIGL